MINSDELETIDNKWLVLDKEIIASTYQEALQEYAKIKNLPVGTHNILMSRFVPMFGVRTSETKYRKITVLENLEIVFEDK